MKNTTRRPPLIIHSAPKQSQQGHLETKVEADSHFSASQHHTLLQTPPAPADSALNNNVLAYARAFGAILQVFRLIQSRGE